MNTNDYRFVYSVKGTLQGIVVQTVLERAGIPCILVPANNDDYLDVLVPDIYAFDAQHLLYPECRTGEIFCVPQTG